MVGNSSRVPVSLYGTVTLVIFCALWALVSASCYVSAKRAYECGVRHFDTVSSRAYDIPTAEYFLRRSLAMDPTQPYVRHQLARILFLKSELVGALSLVTQEIELFKEQASPSSYYVRGLIYGYMDDFKKAAVDYEVYLKSDVNNWAAINDYAWVLIQDNRSHDALNALNWGLSSWPDNPWLLNSKVVALYELGRFDDARTVAAEALKATQNIQPAQWSQAYPGNDPRIAREGVFALQESVRSNMHSILKTYRSTTTSVTY